MPRRLKRNYGDHFQELWLVAKVTHAPTNSMCASDAIFKETHTGASWLEGVVR